MKRAIVIVMDGCGAGAAPDAEAYGDLDQPATLRHVWERCGPLNAPNLISLGLFSAAGVEGLGTPIATYGRLEEQSKGKDSVTGHWEMMGILTAVPFPTYPAGFPLDLITGFSKATGREVLANKPASGTAIIQEFGEEHMRTGKPIVYTSADSVFQIACHEDVVPIDQLYDFCLTARALCVAPNNVQRVIARPFLGNLRDGFERTGRRKDFPLIAPPNIIDVIGEVAGVGVVPELFGHRGFIDSPRTQSNAQHAIALDGLLQGNSRFIFANFEDFDMLYGHRNDVLGFGKAIEDFDVVVGSLLSKLGEDDLLIITADHGNDPTSPSTDHSREFVPCLVYQKGKPGRNFGTMAGMWCVGATVASHLGVDLAGKVTFDPMECTLL